MGLNDVLDIWSGKGVHPRDQVEKFFDFILSGNQTFTGWRRWLISGLCWAC